MGAEGGQSFAPGACIGMLGGGQLGRMTALAAARLGFRVHVYSPEPGGPAAQVAAAETVAAYGDETALASFAAAVDVVTFEFENVPDATAEFLARLKPTRPSPKVLHICQQRLREKDFLASIKVATARYMEVGGPQALGRAARTLGYPCVLKTAQLGYDGKGQVRIEAGTKPDEAWAKMGAELGILEAYVEFSQEVSVILARGHDGQTAVYPPVENHHRSHILDTTVVPARISPALAMKAEAISRHVAEELKVVGLLAVEMFVTPAGEVLVNELAPRPHNSGHWTIDACATSQFEQFVRAICGLPLGSVERHADAVMKNLIGEEANAWRDILAEPGARLHLYGKRETRPGRKMGHVTRLSPRR